MKVNARIKHHTLTTDVDFTPAPNEDYVDFKGWVNTDLALNEIGVNTFREKAYINIEGTIYELTWGVSPTYANSDASYSGTLVSGSTLAIPDSDVTVNGVMEGAVVSVKQIDIEINDGAIPPSLITPDSVDIIGNNITIQVPASGGFDPFPFAGDIYAMQYNGANKYTRTAANVFPDMTSISMGAKFKSSSAVDRQTIIAFDTASGSNRSFGVVLRGGTGVIDVYLWPDSTGVLNTFTTSAGWNDGTWHHIAVTWDGTTTANAVKIYIDGVLDTQGTATGTGVRNMTASNSYVTFGAIASGTWFFDGLISEPFICKDTVLTPTEIAAIATDVDIRQYNPWFYWRDEFGVFTDKWEIPDVMGHCRVESVNMLITDRIAI